MDILQWIFRLTDWMAPKLAEQLPAGIVGGLLIEGGRQIWTRAQERSGMLTGEWTQIHYLPVGPDGEPPKHNEPVKHDIVRVRQRGEIVEGTMERIVPKTPRKRWRFVGRYKDGVLYGHFWSTIPRYPSFGVIFLSQDENGDFSGFYSKQTKKSITREASTTAMPKIPLEWRDCPRDAIRVYEEKPESTGSTG